jgi:polysaccharide pyruvyl transferase WcaK-like protein
MEDNPVFILAGNGNYENRGCEAITIGTVEIIREYYKNPKFIAISFFQNNEQYLKQKKNELDEKISHFRVKIDSKNIFNRAAKVFIPNINPKIGEKIKHKELLKYLDGSTAVINLAGDSYSLDYGSIRFFTDIDDTVIKNKKPIIFWGASIGPFIKNSSIENFMKKHLKKITAIFAREAETIQYLSSIGIENNVYHVADPAFAMKPKKPKGINFPIEKNSIGVNLSPLMARFVMDGNISMWEKRAKKIIEKILDVMPNNLYLIPHVTRINNNDYLFLKDIYESIEDSKKNIFLIPPSYNAMEMKWIIGQLDLFVGARMHSTIAALSSYVPTLSLSYSIKSKGLNNDVFGHQNYLLDAGENTSDNIVKKMKIILENSKEIKGELRKKIPEMEKRSKRSGKYLKDILDLSAD